MIAVGCAEGRDAFVLRQPVRRHHAERPVAQPHERFTAARGGEQRRQVGDDALVVDAAMQLEPVDARANIERHAAGPPIDSTLGLDAPPFGDEHRHQGRQSAGGKVHSRAARLPVRQGTDTERLQALDRVPFGVAIPPPRQAPLSIEEHGLRRPGIDLAAAVPEYDVRVEPIGRHPESRIRGYGPRDPNDRPRPHRTGLHAQIFRTFDERQVRCRERLDERGRLRRWHRDLPEVEQPRHPAIRAARIERRKLRPAGRRVGAPENQRARQKHRVRVGALASVPQNGAANGVALLPVPGDSQVKQRRYGIPIDRRQDGLASEDDGRWQSQHKTTGFTESWGELAL